MAVPFPKCEGIQGEFYLTVDDKLHEHVAPLSDDLPLSVYTQSYRHAAREHIPLHWHSDVQLTWVYEGALDYTVEGGSLALTPDDLLLVNAGHLHGSRTVQGDTRTLCINFASEQLFPPALLRRYICPLLEDAAFSHAVLPLRAEWSEILRGCCAREGEPDCFAVYELLVQVLRELTRSFRGGTEKDGEDARLFQTALRYLHEHYSEPLSAGQLASAAAVNRTMLSVLFKKYTGMTPTADYRDLRRNGLQSAQPLYRAVSPALWRLTASIPQAVWCGVTGTSADYTTMQEGLISIPCKFEGKPATIWRRYGRTATGG